jgi:AcrR family transcriptional regulator
VRGLPKANLHYYFHTKVALYRRVLEDLFEDWHHAAGPFDAGDDPVEAITFRRISQPHSLPVQPRSGTGPDGSSYAHANAHT